MIVHIIGTVICGIVLYWLLKPIFWLHCILRDSIRLALYHAGYRVFTIKELQILGYAKEIKDGVVEAEVCDSKTFEGEVVVTPSDVWGNAALELESFNKQCRSLPAPKRKRKY